MVRGAGRRIVVLTDTGAVWPHLSKSWGNRANKGRSGVGQIIQLSAAVEPSL
jgi:hypothetical protein